MLVSPRLADAIRRWLAIRGDEPGYLFLGVRGGDASRPMNGDCVRKALSRWAKSAGIKAACRPHGLRHSAATEVAKRGSLAQLMALGGWASFSAARRDLDERSEERKTALALVDI